MMKFVVVFSGFATIGVIVLTLILCFLLMLKNWMINVFKLIHLLKYKDDFKSDEIFCEIIISSGVMIAITLAFVNIARLINETILPYFKTMNLF